jgi:hypothetical protein
MLVSDMIAVMILREGNVYNGVLKSGIFDNDAF